MSRSVKSGIMATHTSPKVEKNAIAVGFMIGACALFAATTILGKILGLGAADHPGLSPFQISAGRFCFALLALLVVLAARPSLRPDFGGAKWGWHLARSVCGWMGVTCLFAAIARMPVADATAISFLNPMFTLAVSTVFLGEALGLRKILAAGLSLCGAFLILRPGTDAFQVAGLIALAAAAFMGVEVVIIKRLSDSEPAMRVLLINNCIGAALSGSVAMLVWHAPSAGQWLLLMSIGCVMVLGQSLFIQSMKRAAANFVAPVFYSVLIFVALYDFLLFGAVPTVFALIGAGMIVSGALILVFKDRV